MLRDDTTQPRDNYVYKLHMSAVADWFCCKLVPGSRTWKIGRAKSGSFYCQTWKGVQYSEGSSKIIIIRICTEEARYLDQDVAN